MIQYHSPISLKNRKKILKQRCKKKLNTYFRISLRLPREVKSFYCTHIAPRSKIPVFDSFLKKKVLYPALVAAYGTFINFTDARYAILMLAVIKNGSPASAMLQPALELKVRYLQVIVLILSLPDCFVICLQMMVNPALCAPQSGYGVDNHLRADILLIKQTKDYWAPCALDSIVVVSATGFLFISLYWR